MVGPLAALRAERPCRLGRYKAVHHRTLALRTSLRKDVVAVWRQPLGGARSAQHGALEAQLAEPRLADPVPVKSPHTDVDLRAEVRGFLEREFPPATAAHPGGLASLAGQNLCVILFQG